MEELTEKVENIEKRLNELVNGIGELVKEPSRRRARYPARTARQSNTVGQPSWVVHLFKSLGEISTELGSVKKTLSARKSTGNGHSPNQLVRAITEVDVQHDAPVQGHPEATPLATLSTNGRAGIEVEAQRDDPEVQHNDPKVQHNDPKVQHNDPEVQHNDPVQGHPEPVPPAAMSTLDTDASDHSLPPTFVCDYEDIGPSLNEVKFKEFSSHPTVKTKGYFKVSVQRLPPLRIKANLISQLGEHHSADFSCQRESEGFVQLTPKKIGQARTRLEFPLLESPKASWSLMELKGFWENTLKDPLQDMVYVFGEPLFPDIELSPGQGLEERNGRALPGIGTTYMYLSPGVTYSIMHGEDVELRSINLLRSGAHKCWLVIEPAYAEELQNKMRQQFPAMAKCSQGLRHLNRLITPNQLDRWAIPYSLDYCKPGEAIVTEPRAFHQVLNMGPNYAIAVNILYGSSPPIPRGYRFCSTSCGTHVLTAAHLKRQVQRPPAEFELGAVTDLVQQPISRARKKDVPAREALNEPTTTQSPIAEKKRKSSVTEIQPRKLRVAPQIHHLSDVVSGKEAFHRLCSLIRCWRDQFKPPFQIIKGIDLAVQLVHLIIGTEENPELTKFLNRFGKLKLACIIDAGKGDRASADPAALNKLMDDLKWERTNKKRTKLGNFLKEGRQWKKLCGIFDGLLCLIPLDRDDGISGRTYFDLNKRDIQQFHSLLVSDEFTSLCRVGSILQMSILQNKELPEFKWETEDPQKIAQFSIQKLLPFMEEFPLIEESVWEPEKYDWPKPDYWPWEWPQHPGWIPPSDTQCDLCQSQECDCIISCLPQIKPRITNEPGKGQGIRAVGTTYGKGQILGELLGEFVPLDTFNNGWAIEFGRPDLSDGPIAQIHSKEIGNWVRKVNHSCNPSAKFEVVKISGLWRQMIIAIRDIFCNEEITAFCGSTFLRG